MQGEVLGWGAANTLHLQRSAETVLLQKALMEAGQLARGALPDFRSGCQKSNQLPGMGVPPILRSDLHHSPGNAPCRIPSTKTVAGLPRRSSREEAVHRAETAVTEVRGRMWEADAAVRAVEVRVDRCAQALGLARQADDLARRT